MSVDIFDCHNWGARTLLAPRRETRDANKQLRMNREPPTTQNDLVQNDSA